MRAAVIATGWLGDTIACTVAATSLAKMGYETTLFIRWPQLKPILDNDRRFTTRTYWRVNVLKLFTPLINLWFDIVVWEPRWNFEEPFTSEMRRLLGCDPTPEYSLHLNNVSNHAHKAKNARPVISISRDFYKRLYGRDIDDLINRLNKFAEIKWVGLNSNQHSKHGKNISLLEDARSIADSDLFVGPEGGMLWLAAGLGKATVYFTEHIHHSERHHGVKSLEKILGSKNHFPEKNNHTALPRYCTNEDAVKVIWQALFSKQ